MRLVHITDDGQLELTKDLPIHDVPHYAILSHVWGKDDEEVTFSDMTSCSGQGKAGYVKLTFCRDQAIKDGLQFFWIDTCCIDKSNSAELSEAINSMFRWYSQAVRCYVFLSDVSTKREAGPLQRDLSDLAFRRSRWHTRGWTLQEMLAPNWVLFFSKEGEQIGTKWSLKDIIHEVTSIPVDAIRGSPLSSFAKEERMRWGEQRNTTRVEDRAYCLLGIFNVFLPPIYGEGLNAFTRLEREIALLSDDPLLQPRKLIPTDGNADATMKDKRELRQKLSAALAFPQMDTRRLTIQRPYSATCAWLLKHAVYQQWSDRKPTVPLSRVLWIKGKPGAGKSTLMRFAYESAKKSIAKDEILLSYFFNARGSDLQRTTVGMYRSLLIQLFEAADDMLDLLDGCKTLIGDDLQSPGWSIEILCNLFYDAIGRLGQRRLKCFVDALDECDEQQVRDMVAFFCQLQHDNVDRVSFCFTSRHYPAIGVHDCTELVLEDQASHNTDLATYVQGYLAGQHSQYMREVGAQVLERASGVFLWVVLVVNIINTEYARGRVQSVKARLREIPQKLSDVFRGMLRKDSEDMESFLLCLRFILFSARPLKLAEFYHAMVTGAGPADVTASDPDTTGDDMERFLLHHSKGLAELTSLTTVRTVQFIHESVRDFLIKDGGLRELFPNDGDVQVSAHEQLKICCYHYLNAVQSIKGCGRLATLSSESSTSPSRALDLDFPFLDYAHRFVLYHAEQAASTIPQHDFLQTFPLETWIIIRDLYHSEDGYERIGDATLLYVLARENLPRLISSVMRGQLNMEPSNGRHKYPLFVAIAYRNREAVQALLLQQDDRFTEALFKSTHRWEHHTPFAWLVENGHTELAELFLRSSDVDAEAEDINGQNLLCRAVEASNLKAVVWLADNVAVNIDSPDSQGITPLMCAALCSRRLTILRFLLEKGANMEACTIHGSTALMMAAETGNAEAIKELTSHGAQLELVDRRYRSALMIAVMRGQTAAVQQLLQAGASVLSICYVNNWRTALHVAAALGRKDILLLLLDHGAETQARDWDGMTPLMLAFINGWETVLELLVEHGAEIDVSDYHGRALSSMCPHFHRRESLQGTQYALLMTRCLCRAYIRRLHTQA